MKYLLILLILPIAFAQRRETPIDGEPPTPDSPLPDPSQYQWSVCGVSGDPHFRMFDGGRHHFMGVGDFVLVENPAIHIQARFKRCNSASCVHAVAIVIGTNKAFIEYLSGNTIRLDTVEYRRDDPIVMKGMVLQDGETTVRMAGGKAIIGNIKRADTVQITARKYAVTVSLPQTDEYLGKTNDLCGNFDKDELNEFLPFGGGPRNTSLKAAPMGNYRLEKYANYINAWGNTWSICPTKTADLSSCNTNTLFFNKTSGVQPTIAVPSVNPQHVDAAAAAAAETYCNSQFADVPAAYDNCMFDTAVFGITAVQAQNMPAEVAEAVNTEKLIKLWEAIGMGLGIVAGVALVGAVAAFAGSTIFFAHHPERLPFGKKQKKIFRELDEAGVLEEQESV